jgi:hypothetical protein
MTSVALADTAAPGIRRRRAALPPTVLALARVEGRRLLRHPFLLLGVALSLALAVAGALSNGGVQATEIAGMGSFPLAAGTLLAANAAGLRSRRDATDELYATLPRPAATRTAAQLLALAWVVPVAVALVAVMYVAFGAHDGLVVRYDGRTHLPALAELAQGPFVVVALGALGVLLARRAPSPLVAPPVVVALLALEIPLAVWGSPATARWALPFVNDAIAAPNSWVPCEPGDLVAHCNLILGFDVRGMAIHLAYLAGAAALFACGALLAGRRAVVATGALVPLLGLSLVAAGS